MRTIRWLAVVAVIAAGCATNREAPAATPQTSGIAASTVPAATTGVQVQSTVAIGGGQALGLTATDDRVWAVSFDAGTLVSIDPETNAVDETVDIGGGAASAMALDGDVWVVAYGGRDDLYRVDSSPAVVGAYSIADLCCDLSAGTNIWALSTNGSVHEIDPESGDVIAHFPIEVDSSVHVNGVFADGAYWYSSDTTALARLDPVTGESVEHDVGGGVPFFARDGLLWGASSNEVWAVDTAAGDVVERVPVPNSIEVISLEVAGDSVFVGIRSRTRAGAVLHLDRTNGELLDEFAVDIPARMALAFGSLWVTDSGSDNVVRIGPISAT